MNSHRFLGMGLLSLTLLGCPPKPVDVTPDIPDANASLSAGDEAAMQMVAEPEPLTEEEIHQQVNEAVSWLTTGQPELAQQALTRLNELGAEAPDLAEIPYNKGVAYQILGDEDLARKEYLRATDIDSTLGSAWLNLGAIAERDGDLSRALQAYRAGLREAPDDPELVVGLIGVLRKMGRTDQAIEEAKQALARNANNINVYNNLGQVYIEQGNLELAQFVYQKALNDIPGAEQNALIHANLGQVYLLQELRANARAELEKALELDGSLVIAQMYLAQFHMENRDWESAVTVLEQTLPLEPNNPAIHMNLGISYRGMQRYDEARQSYLNALELDPTNPDPYLNLAVLYGDYQQQYDDALAALDTFVDEGGGREELVEEWESALKKAKRKFDRAQQRRQEREERDRRRELARQAEEEERARQEAEQQALEAQQAAENPEPPAGDSGDPPADTVGEDAPAVDDGASSDETSNDGAVNDGAVNDGEQPAEAAQSEPAASPTQPEPSTASEEAVEAGSAGGDSPWGGASSTEAAQPAETETPAAASEPAAEEPAPPPAEEPAPEPPADNEAGGSPWGGPAEGERSATSDEILQAADAGGAVGAGVACSGIGECGSSSLECAQDGVCRDAGSEGTLLRGMSCQQDSQCAFGLDCVSGACLDPMPSAPPTEGGDAGSQINDNPWGN